MSWHGYILVRDWPTGWNNKHLAFDALHTGIGLQDHPIPAHINLTRVALDESVIIIEAEFQDDELTRDNIIQIVADALGRNFGQVDATLNIQLMGGSGAAWEQSRQATLAHIAANMSAWEPEAV